MTSNYQTAAANNSSLPDTFPTHTNTPDDDYDYASYFSAKEDIPPVILALLIVTFNGMVLVLVSRNKRLRTITNMLLCSLALSDLLTGVVSVPLYITCNIYRQSALCIADDIMLRFTSVSIVCHLTAVSMDRYLAIIHSLRYTSLVTRKRCLCVILPIWLLSAVMALAQLSWIDPVHHDLFQAPSPDVIRKEIIYDVTSVVVFFAVPFLCMMYIYAKIYLEISRQTNSIRRRSMPAHQKTKEVKNYERRAVVIFAVMLFVYTVCWLPYFILRLSDTSVLHPVVVYVTQWLRFLTSFLNPCLYILGKRDFREALRARRQKRESGAGTLLHLQAPAYDFLGC